MVFFPKRLASLAVIDDSACRKCSLCHNKCPSNHPVSRKKTLHTYAGWIRDPRKASLSASGGIAWQLTETAIKNGGVVYGASYDNAGVLRHQRAESLDEADKFRLSKYVQSNFSGCVQSVKNDLEIGRKVLVTGTPCQIAGLYAYLGRDYSNLITADLVCHGVPDWHIMISYIKGLLGIEKFSDVRFRNTHGFEFSVYDKKKKIYRSHGMIDRYMVGFMYGYLYRDNCYSCQYANKDRISDITLGDFWGLNKKTMPHLPVYRGISLCMTHTESGEQLLQNCKDYLYLFERTEEEAIQGNKQLRTPYPKPSGRENIEKHYNGDNTLSLLKQDHGIQRIRFKAFAKRPIIIVYHFLLNIGIGFKLLLNK